MESSIQKVNAVVTGSMAAELQDRASDLMLIAHSQSF